LRGRRRGHLHGPAGRATCRRLLPQRRSQRGGWLLPDERPRDAHPGLPVRCTGAADRAGHRSTHLVQAAIVVMEAGVLKMSDRAGFTLMEVLVAMVLLGFAILGVQAAITDRFVRDVGHEDYRATAHQLAS